MILPDGSTAGGSPSQAIKEFVRIRTNKMDASINGMDKWKNKDGKTLNDLCDEL